MKKILLLLLLISCLLFLRPSAVKAAGEFRFQENSTWELKEDGTIFATSKLKVTNLTRDYYSTGYYFWLPAEEVRDLSANYDDGYKIQTNQEADQEVVNGLTYKYQKIELKFPREIGGFGASFNVNLSFTMVGSLAQKGQTREFNLPNLAMDQESTQNITVKAPKSFGNAHFPADDPKTSREDNEFYYITYENEQLVKKSQTIVFGDQMSRRLTYDYPIENRDILPSFFKFYLPMTNDKQKVYVKSVDPKPVYEGIDKDGSSYFYFFLLPAQKLTVKAEVEILTKANEVNFDRSGMLKDFAPDLDKYVTKEQYWQIDNPIVKAKAKELIKTEDTVFTNAKRVYDYIVSTFEYSQEKLAKNERLGAVEALKNPKYVVCQEYADAYIAILRAGDIPAREYYGMTDAEELTSSEKNLLHAWTEVYIPKYGWLTVDPTWGESGVEFGKLAFDHLAINFDTGSDEAYAVVMKNNNPYDMGTIYEKNVKLSEIKATASGRILPGDNPVLDSVMLANRPLLLGASIIIFIALALITALTRLIHKKRNNK